MLKCLLLYEEKHKKTNRYSKEQQKIDNMSFILHSYLVDVFVNGEYQGVYSLTEQIEVKDGRIEGEKDSTDVLSYEQYQYIYITIYAFGNFSLDSSKFSEWICLGNSKTDAYNETIKENKIEL